MRVGRVYFEDAHGYVLQGMYGAHPAFRRPEVRVQGRTFYQVRQFPDGTWVYRADAAPAGGLTDADVLDLCAPGDPAWVAPPDYVTSPSPAAVALAAFEAALEALRTHPEHAALVAKVTAPDAGEDRIADE